MYFTLFITVILTAVVLVVGAYVIAKLIGPRSYNKLKGEPYESGIPTRGSSWLPVSIGYYLFAILFLMFDVETLFLYPWAVVVKEFGTMALVSIGFFLLVLVFGLAYACSSSWYLYLAWHTLGGKERWNGSKKTENQGFALRGVQGQRIVGEDC